MTKTSHTFIAVGHAPIAQVTSARGTKERARFSQLLLVLVISLAPFGLAIAGPQVKPAPPPRPVTRTVIVQPSPSARFQQTVQQQQVQDQLQKSQVEQQNHQAVRDNSRLPHASNPQMQQQIDQANAAQQRIDQSRQQDMINRYQATPPPSGRVVMPVKNPPAKPAGGG